MYGRAPSLNCTQQNAMYGRHRSGIILNKMLCEVSVGLKSTIPEVYSTESYVWQGAIPELCTVKWHVPIHST